MFAYVNYAIIQQTKINPDQQYMDPSSSLSGLMDSLEKVEKIHVKTRAPPKTQLRVFFPRAGRFGRRTCFLRSRGPHFVR